MTPSQKPFFYVFLPVSTAGHLAILSLLFFVKGGLWFSKEDTVFQAVPVRIDQIALPDFPEELPAEKQKTQQPLPPPLPEKKPKKKKIKKAKPEKTQETGPSDKKKTPPKTPPPPSVNKGNRLSEGAETGKENNKEPPLLSTDQILKINAYMSLVEQRIKSGWNLPLWLADRGLKVQIEIQINSQGNVIYRNIVSSSGSRIFDSMALKAVENAGPYPPPPSELKDLVQDGVVFNLQSRK